MPVTQIRRIQATYLKVEATEGTDPTPGATDAIQLLEPATFTVGAEFPNARPDLINGLLDEAAPLPPGAKWAELTGKLHIRGAGVAYSASAKPEIDAILQAAGLSSTLDATGGAEKYTYDTISASMKTVTAHCFHGLETGVWVKHALVAGRASRVVLRLQHGRPSECEFTIRGLYVAPTDTSPTAPTYQTGVAPNWGTPSGTAAFAIGAFSGGLARECTITIENALAPRGSANAVDGLAGFLQTKRRILLNATIEGVRIADYNQYLKWTGATSEALAVRCPGGTGTQYNRFTIDGDKATHLEAPAYGEDQGLVTVALSGLLSPEGTNRSKVVFT